MEAWMLFVGVAGLLFTGGGMIAAGVWAVGKISAALDTHGARIDNLSRQVDSLSRSLDKLDDKHDQIAVRVARVEERIGGAA